MNYSKSEIDLICADALDELNYKQKKLLLASLNPGNADRLKYADALIKITDAGVYNKVKEKLQSEDFRSRVVEKLAKKRVECVTVKSSGYPQLLKQTPVPPLVLYVRGRKELLRERMVCVVGSRRTTVSTLEVCKKICSGLSEYLTVTTGVADGADRTAAESALRTSGNVICVLPGGHGSKSFSDANFMRDVEERGLTVSEFPPDFKVQRHTFTLRNRVLAGMAEATLVISADLDGGALSTAGYAADYSREVFALPHGAGVPSGRGCNQLIKNGAYLCDCAEDVLSVLGFSCRCEEKADKPEPELDDGELQIIKALKEHGELHSQKLAELLGKPLTEVVTALSMLEIEGLVARTGGNSFVAL